MHLEQSLSVCLSGALLFSLSLSILFLFRRRPKKKGLPKETSSSAASHCLFHIAVCPFSSYLIIHLHKHYQLFSSLFQFHYRLPLLFSFFFGHSNPHFRQQDFFHRTILKPVHYPQFISVHLVRQPVDAVYALLCYSLWFFGPNFNSRCLLSPFNFARYIP